MENGNSVTVFGLKCINSAPLVLTSPNYYKHQEKVTVSKFEILGRMCKLFKKFNDFDWTNVLFAGGLLSAMMEPNYSSQNNKNSDIDLYIFTKEDYFRVFEYFKNKLNKMYSFGYAYTGVTNIISPDFDRSIQLILCDQKGKKSYNLHDSQMKLLNNFDLTYCQVGFNGTKIIYTEEYIKTCVSRITKITSPTIHAYRLIKALDRGFSIEKPLHHVFIKNYFDSYDFLKIDGKDICRADKIRHIDNISEQELRHNALVIKNLNKNFIPCENDTVEFVKNKVMQTYALPIFFDNNEVNKYIFNGNSIHLAK